MKLKTKINKTLSVGVIFDQVGEGVFEAHRRPKMGEWGPKRRDPYVNNHNLACFPYTY